ncbi:hypothetical protein SAMN03080615_00021 [Amphritea atlantica]|uniref:FAR-17a/AIG1-like protein n=1 Tax=Amphritea atlantica TaxID=355243 RepID=A0A1H9CK95_9GAMM|nr:hypothetical protein [Amphritea atlantica]SEQ01491.1 hypothetical protein SAMN03080615_00021 [Amphritea atlantica]
MTELQLLYLSQLFRIWTVGLCLGTSTIAMTFYFYVVSKGFTLAAENRMMHIVYTVLRIGMVLVVISELTTFIYNYRINNFIYWTDNPEFMMRLTIFCVIVSNAIAMQNRWITMWLGPVIAGGSWYAYFFFSVWIETESTYPTLLLGYGYWLVSVAVLLSALRLYLTRHSSDGPANNR